MASLKPEVEAAERFNTVNANTLHISKTLVLIRFFIKIFSKLLYESPIGPNYSLFMKFLQYTLMNNLNHYSEITYENKKEAKIFNGSIFGKI